VLSSPFSWLRISHSDLKFLQFAADFVSETLTNINLSIIIFNSCLEIMKAKDRIHTSSGEPEHGETQRD
jgi:hypothetical protein